MKEAGGIIVSTAVNRIYPKSNYPNNLSVVRAAVHVITHRRCFTILPHLPFMLSFNASVNTSCTPCPVLAEHSMYLAPISFATAAPCSDVTGVCPCALSIRCVCSSRRRSVLVPTNISGVPSQKWYTSGNHWTDEISEGDSRNVKWCSPCPEHLPDWQGSQWRTRWGWHRFRGNLRVVGGHIPPAPRCPIAQVQPTFLQTGLAWHSSRRQWVCKPEVKD